MIVAGLILINSSLEQSYKKAFSFQEKDTYRSSIAIFYLGFQVRLWLDHHNSNGSLSEKQIGSKKNFEEKTRSEQRPCSKLETLYLRFPADLSLCRIWNEQRRTASRQLLFEINNFEKKTQWKNWNSKDKSKQVEWKKSNVTSRLLHRLFRTQTFAWMAAS